MDTFFKMKWKVARRTIYIAKVLRTSKKKMQGFHCLKESALQNINAERLAKTLLTPDKKNFGLFTSQPLFYHLTSTLELLFSVKQFSLIHFYGDIPNGIFRITSQLNATREQLVQFHLVSIHLTTSLILSRGPYMQGQLGSLHFVLAKNLSINNRN